METFEINGYTFGEGDKLIISSPELGTIEVYGTLAGYRRDEGFTLTFGLVKTPLTCRSLIERNDVNARLSLTRSAGGQLSLGLYYCCSCGYGIHNHALEWEDLSSEGNRITANRLGAFGNIPHDHPVVNGYRDVTPRPGRIETPLTPLAIPLFTRQHEEAKAVKPKEVQYEPQLLPKPAPQRQYQLF